jgi:hypothetical protein
LIVFAALPQRRCYDGERVHPGDGRLDLLFGVGDQLVDVGGGELGDVPVGVADGVTGGPESFRPRLVTAGLGLVEVAFDLGRGLSG